MIIDDFMIGTKAKKIAEIKNNKARTRKKKVNRNGKYSKSRNNNR